MIAYCNTEGAAVMAFSSTAPTESPIAVIGRWFRNWTGNRASEAQLDKFDAQELSQIARDVGVNTRELRALAGKWPDAASLLTQRMALLHLDPEEIAHKLPAVSNDLRKLCSMCRTKQRCGHDVDNNAADPVWQHYCPNAGTLTALVNERAERSQNSKIRK
jgi:hypothetical protein